MRVLVFEPDHSGHRMQFARVLIEALSPWSNDVILFTSAEAAASEEYRTHLDALTSTFRLEVSHNLRRGAPSRMALSKLSIFRDALRDVKPDHVYVPYADGLAQTLGATHWLSAPSLPAGLEIEGILMRGRFAYPAGHWSDCLRAVAWLTAVRMAPFTILHQLDPIPFTALKNRGGALGDRSRLIPEPVEAIQKIEMVEARSRLGIPVDGRYVASMGSLDVRKGTHLLIQAFARAKLQSNDRLLLMGNLHPDVRSLITNHMEPEIRDKRLILFDRYVSDEMLGLGMNAVDVVCTPYPKHIGSSGIVVRAASIGKPILASEYGWMGAVISAFQLGTTCPVSNLDRFARQISESLEQASTFRLSECGLRFTQFHTVPNFSAHITARLRMRLTASAPMEHLTWEDVMAKTTNMHPLLSPA